MKYGIGYVMCFLLGGAAASVMIKAAGFIVNVAGKDLVCYPLHNPIF